MTKLDLITALAGDEPDVAEVIRLSKKSKTWLQAEFGRQVDAANAAFRRWGNRRCKSCGKLNKYCNTLDHGIERIDPFKPLLAATLPKTPSLMVQHEWVVDSLDPH